MHICKFAFLILVRPNLREIRHQQICPGQAGHQFLADGNNRGQKLDLNFIDWCK